MYNVATKWDSVATGGWDGITQMYPVMVYTRRVLLQFFQSLFNGAGFSFPMIEWTLGMGDNTISALNWHGFGDPLYFFTIFLHIPVLLKSIIMEFIGKTDIKAGKNKSVVA